ncbi:MAG: TonB-dependent receptor [Gammaproteobacteria bacterium HGW-Gammaproteobacteria-15]|nr:MAG: TonB-dependent receptor [Gammaproteobacteria bacterium HGW-Gammaproteobacteria-15]
MIKHGLQGACSASIFICCVQVAWADDSTTAKIATNEVERIVVTATKRNTEFQDSDASVTVLGITAIDQARLRDFSRIDDLVPNVQFTESGQRGSIFITVRGVESNPFIVNRAAVYIDGIPFRELSNSVLNQIESVEVLRGPQATLYGANTESGLILVTTKPPTETAEGNIRITGTHFPSGNSIETDGALSGSLLPGTLTGSVAFTLAQEDAYLKNKGTSTGETGEFTEHYLQGRLRWTPNDRLTVNALAYWLDLDAPGIFGQQYVPLNLALYNSLYADSFNGGRLADDWTYYEDAPKYFTEQQFVAGLSATYQLEYGALDLAASHRQVEKDHKGLDFDLTATPAVAGREANEEKFNNVEARFSSLLSDSFDYMVGASYYQATNDNIKATFIGPGDLNSYIAAPVQRKKSEDVGLFGSANFYASTQLRITAGLRYDQAKRSTVQQAGTLDLGFGSVVVYPEAQLAKTYDILLPRLALHYKLTDDLALHASAARGYIPGGFNLVAVQQGVADDDIISYDSETLWSREVGFKWRSADQKMRLSGAVFYINSDNWQEIQIATDEQGRPVSSDFIGSDASIRSKGLELEGHWQVSSAFSMDAHIGYVDAKYRDLQVDESLNVRHQPIQFVPKYDGGMALRYQWQNGIYARTEVGFTGETSLRARGDIRQAATTTLGLQLGYVANKFAVRLFGENLTNERKASGLAIENLAFGNDGLFYAPLDAPRVIGLELETWF